MNQGFEQIKQAIILAVEQVGGKAISAFSPDWAKHYGEPVIAVGFRTVESRGTAMSNYLGQQIDPETQISRELYGTQLEMTLSLDIYSPATVGISGCDETLPLLHQVMVRGLPSGLKPLELKWEEPSWDENTGMFLRKGNLICSAFFIATTDEDSTLLTDFILKGVMTT